MAGQFGVSVDGQQVDNTSSVSLLLALMLGALQNSSGGGGGGNVVITGPLGQQLAAGSIPVVLTAAQLAAIGTSANQTTQITAEQAIQALLAHGQAIMASSVPVVVASDQSPIPTNLATVAGSAIAFGQSVMAGSLPVTLASDQPAIVVGQAAAFWNMQGAKVASATNSPSRFLNIGANVTLNVKSSAGNVFSAYCNNANAAARYFQIHNTAAVPTSTVTVPVLSFLIPPNSQMIIGADFFTNEGLNLSLGIAFAFSTTRDVYTAGSAGDQQTAINYV